MDEAILVRIKFRDRLEFIKFGNEELESEIFLRKGKKFQLFVPISKSTYEFFKFFCYNFNTSVRSFRNQRNREIQSENCGFDYHYN